MAMGTTGLLKKIGLGVAFLGVFALMVVAVPAVRAQVRGRPLEQIRHQLLGGSQLGMTVRDVDAADVKRENLGAATGAIVEDVETDSPAAKAGIKAGDVIVAFDGEKVRSARHLMRLVEETPEGREVEARVVRAGANVSVKVAPEAWQFRGFSRFAELPHFTIRPETFDFGFRGDRPRADVFMRMLEPNRGRLGVGVQDLTEQLGDYFGTREGALVTAVDDDTPAKTAGIKAGDVITKINGQTIRTSDDLRRRLTDTSGEVTVTVLRDKRELTLKATLRDEGTRKRIVRHL